MKKFLSVAALAATAAALSAAPALAAAGDCRELMSFDEDPPVPTGVTVCRQDAWFHAAQQRLSNAPNSGTPSWNTTAPTAAFPTGGAAYGALRIVDIVDPGNPSAVPTFSGTYTGTLDNIALTAFNSSIYNVAAGANPLITTLTIDGEAVFANGGIDDPDLPVIVEKVDDKTGKLKFAFTNLAATLKTLKVANGATAAHTITVSFVNKYWGDSNFVMFYDAADYPSGLTFNMETDEFGGISDYTQIQTEA